jgi:chromosome segregation ATPase
LLAEEGKTMFVELLKDLADPKLSERLKEHAAELTAAAKEHRAAKSALDDTHLSLANQRNDLERREAAVQAKEAALKKRESEVEIAEQKLKDDLTALDAQQRDLAARRAEADARIRTATLSEEKLSRVRTEAAALAAQLGGLR